MDTTRIGVFTAFLSHPVYIWHENVDSMPSGILGRSTAMTPQVKQRGYIKGVGIVYLYKELFAKPFYAREYQV